MPPLPKTDPDEEAGRKKRTEQQATALCASVMKSLGRPADFFKISVIQLWDDHYRVNVQTGTEVTSLRIAHSFFVASDENGNVVESVPPISRLY